MTSYVKSLETLKWLLLSINILPGVFTARMRTKRLMGVASRALLTPTCIDNGSNIGGMALQIPSDLPEQLAVITDWSRAEK
jgi:hypothetical protein